MNNNNNNNINNYTLYYDDESNDFAEDECYFDTSNYDFIESLPSANKSPVPNLVEENNKRNNANPKRPDTLDIWHDTSFPDNFPNNLPHASIYLEPLYSNNDKYDFYKGVSKLTLHYNAVFAEYFVGLLFLPIPSIFHIINTSN